MYRDAVLVLADGVPGGATRAIPPGAPLAPGAVPAEPGDVDAMPAPGDAGHIAGLSTDRVADPAAPVGACLP